MHIIILTYSSFNEYIFNIYIYIVHIIIIVALQLLQLIASSDWKILTHSMNSSINVNESSGWYTEKLWTFWKSNDKMKYYIFIINNIELLFFLTQLDLKEEIYILNICSLKNPLALYVYLWIEYILI